MLVTYCCETSHSKIKGLRATVYTYYISQFLWVRNSGTFGLMVFQEAAAKTSARAAWGQRLCFQRLARWCLLLVRNLRSTPSPRAAWVSLLQGGPQNRRSQREQGENHIAFYGLASEVTHLQFCHITFIRSKSRSPATLRGEGYLFPKTTTGYNK